AVRQEVRDVVERVRAAHIRVIMVTGDHQKTALYVAKQVGIFHAGDEMVDGPEFAKLSDEDLLGRLEKITVYSRMTPRDKFRIITLFHKKKKLIAMTGDGINDVPPLVAADLGIAMGSIGTEIAKEAADLILLQDSFITIVDAIKQSRHIFSTLRRVVLYFFATNMGELLIIVFALLANLPLPITAAQILWLNLVTDGFLDVALSTESPDPDLLYRKGWHGQKMRLVDRNLLGKMLFLALPMGIGSLWVFGQYYQENLVLARTMTLLTMAMFQWFNAWNCRSEDKSIFQLGLFSNMWLLAATAFVLALQGLLIYTPVLRSIFHTVPLTAAQWGVIVAVSSPIILLEEARKFFARRWFYRS
ncbi:HAD-IC family P-type ATPase, partial [Methylicorpusculum sp.]|uniref:HAD-IC family P-type ATPase n=1 Tax=Methylicorpusculum sp. TaxID=2713644 RepID=UPI002ABAC5F7